MTEATYSDPFLWRPGRHGFTRLVAHVLIRLLILAPLPPQLQLGAALFPLSLAWPFLAPVETASEPSQKAGGGEGAQACVLRLTDRRSGVSGVGLDPAQGNRTTSGSFIVNPNDPLRGIHATALQTTAFIRHVDASAIRPEAAGPVTERAIQVQFNVAPSSYEISSAQVEILMNGAVVETLPAQVSGAGGTATWPAGRPLVRGATYAARAVIDPAGNSPLSTVPKPVQLVELVFVDRRGEETFAPATSDPRPVVSLNPAQAADVTLLVDGARAQVRVSGTVTDALADIVPDKAADITAVRVGGQSLQITRMSVPTSVERPFAFKGTFTGTVIVPISAGPNAVVVEAVNAVGRTGYDSLTINIDQAINLPQVVATGNVYAEKFLDPFTLIVVPMSSTAADSVIVYHGATAASGSELPLVETSVASLRFEGTTPGLGRSTLTLDAALMANDPMVREGIRGTLSTIDLSILEQPLEFLETSADSGVFRSAALRLPSNQRMELALGGPLNPMVVDVLRAKVGAPAQATSLNETAAGSGRFLGEVPGLGDAVIEVLGIEDGPSQSGRMRVLLTSVGEQVQDLYLALAQIPSSEGLIFQTQVFGPASVVVPAPPAPPATLASVVGNQGSAEGPFEPVWIVARGLAGLRAGDRGELDGQSFELTPERPPQPSTPTPLSQLPSVRFKVPMAFVPDTGNLQVANVKPGPVDPRPRDRNAIKPRLYRLRIDAQSQGLEIRRDAGSVALSKVAAVRGAKMQLTVSFILTVNYGGTVGSSVQSLVVSGDGVAVSNLGQELVAATPSSQEYRVRFSVEVAKTATISSRDITITFSGGQTKTFRRALKVTRGHVVIFAVDGLSKEQFDAALQQTNVPPLEPGEDTALRYIFKGTEPTGQVVNRELSTTFPPITFTRWATIFSGQPPKDTLVPALQWLNRAAIIGGENTFGSANQGIKASDFSLVKDVLFSTGAYNRHFPVDFIYDKLRARNMRSVVIAQQAGLGKGNLGVLATAGDDVWDRAGLSTPAADMASSDPLISGIALDENSTRLAIEQIQKLGENFDLLVVYLPGLDHYLHGAGVAPESGAAEPKGEAFIRSHLHERVNRITRALGELRDTTVFGVFSDHGHFDTDPQKFMDMDFRGQFLQQNGFPSWRDVLHVRLGLNVGDFYDDSFAGGRPRVIFVPQFAMASVYVAGNPGEFGTDWRRPPSVQDLEPLVNSIFNAYVAGRPWPLRPVSDILVRVPASPNTFEGSRYLAVPRDYAPENGLLDQLVELDVLAGYGGIGDDPGMKWSYNAPLRRVSDSISVNSGDIIVLANAADRFQFGHPYKAQHGSLTFADSLVPVAFGFPEATGNPTEDTTLRPILDYFSQFPQGRIDAIAEEPALEAFFFQP